jgi:tripartite-type tricarboxylate transporter receptor subunit TctC
MTTAMRESTILAGLGLAAALLAGPSPVVAQDSFPSRPIRIVVPFAPGGAADTLPRLIGEKLSAKWGQPVIVENRPGATGNVGAEAVARAEPDGYTLLGAPPPPLAVNQNLFPKLGFDPAAFVPVTIIAAVPNVLVVHPDVPATNIRELIAYAKANPDKLSYASTGSGGTPHLTAEMFKAATGVRIVHVPYRAVPLAFVDLLAGQVGMMFANLGDSMQHIRSGKLRAIGIGSRTRWQALPDVPAISEVQPNFVSDTWYAVVAPPKTPAERAEKLSQAIADALRLPDVVKRLNDLSATPVGTSPGETAEFIRQETKRWRDVIISAKVTLD